MRAELRVNCSRRRSRLAESRSTTASAIWSRCMGGSMLPRLRYETAVHGGVEKAPDTLQMPAQIAQVAAACALALVHDHRVLRYAHLSTGEPEPAADVHVLVIEEVALVKAADQLEGAASEEHEHSPNPVRIDALGRLAGHRLLESQSLPEKPPRRGHRPVGRLSAAVGLEHMRRRHADPVLLERLQQAAERIAAQPQIGIQNAEKVAARRTKSRVVIRREATRHVVDEERQWKGRAQAAQRPVLRRVQREQYLKVRPLDGIQVGDEPADVIFVPMADDRNGDHAAPAPARRTTTMAKRRANFASDQAYSATNSGVRSARCR